MDSQQYSDAERPPCTLIEHERATRQQFVKEYVKDYDAVKACLRIGYSPLFATEFAQRFMQEPYTLQLISQYETGETDEEIDEDKERKKVLKALWREANREGAGSSQAARVAALAKLTSIFGMDAAKTSNINVNNSNEGTFVVPGIMNEEQWAQQASEQQDNLIKPQSPAQLKAV